jgi:hypothetical protein
MNDATPSQPNEGRGTPIPEDQSIERRVERAAFETDMQLVVGDVTLPPAGYQSRFSDSLNRDDLEFVPLTNVEVTSLRDGKVSERPFVVLAKRHVRISYPITR